MKRFLYAVFALCMSVSLISCDFDGDDHEPDQPGTETPGNNIPSNPNIFTANGTPYYYGKYSYQTGWSIGSGTVNPDYGYYIFDVDAYSVQLSPEQLKEYNAGTLYNVNSVALRIAIEEFNPLTAKVGDLLKLRIVDDVYDNSGLNSRFYFFYNNSKNQIRYTFTDTLKGEISFLGYANNIFELNLKNVHVYRTGTAPEDAPIEFVLNGRISFLMK